ncbi:MAG: sodium-dependent transporter [Candidatus Binatia bacterium]
MATAAARESFHSTAGFILAAAGSAIGLGNIWGFPYQAAENGGGAFVALYILFVVSIGLPVMLAELSLGRATGLSPVGAFRAAAPGTPWWMVGALGVVTGFFILSFYCVLAGWTLGYLAKGLTGELTAGLSSEQSVAVFTAFVQSNVLEVGLCGIFYLFVVAVVLLGVSAGIERMSSVLMPMFFVLLLLLVVRSVTLPGAGPGIDYLLTWDASKITPKVAIAALSQAFFSLSLGMGAMLTYGSYLSKSQPLAFSAAAVAASDTMVALLAGFMIFPAVFAAGATPAESVGLAFHTMPTIFDQLPAGWLFASAFYFLLAVAALTSAISLLEVVVSYFIDQRGWSRPRAVWISAGACFLLSIPSATVDGVMDTFISLTFDYGLPIGALLMSIFVGWRMPISRAEAEITSGGAFFPLAGVWSFVLRFVVPVAIVFVLLGPHLG